MLDPAVQLALALLTHSSFVLRTLHALVLVVFVLLMRVLAQTLRRSLFLYICYCSCLSFDLDERTLNVSLIVGAQLTECLSCLIEFVQRLPLVSDSRRLNCWLGLEFTAKSAVSTTISSQDIFHLCQWSSIQASTLERLV